MVFTVTKSQLNTYDFGKTDWTPSLKPHLKEYRWCLFLQYRLVDSIPRHTEAVLLSQGGSKP